MADNRIIPNTPLARPYDVEALEKLRLGGDADYVDDQCVCAKNECDDCNPGEAEAISRPNDAFQDLTKSNILNATHDTINACFNAWEMACRFQDPELADYYLQLMTLTTQFQKKIKALKKKNH